MTTHFPGINFFFLTYVLDLGESGLQTNENIPFRKACVHFSVEENLLFSLYVPDLRIFVKTKHKISISVHSTFK